MAGANNSALRGREMGDRLYHGLDAALRVAPDAAYVVKVEDDTIVDFEALARAVSRPLCDAALYGNCRAAAHEPRPYCDGGSGYLLSTKLARRLLRRPPPAGPEDVAASARAADPTARRNSEDAPEERARARRGENFERPSRRRKFREAAGLVARPRRRRPPRARVRLQRRVPPRRRRARSARRTRRVPRRRRGDDAPLLGGASEKL